MHVLRNARGRGGDGVLTQASGYNFPLFLVYSVDMPGVYFAVLPSVSSVIPFYL